MKIKNILKEVVLGILPVVVIITLLHFSIAPVANEMYVKFLVSTCFVILGLFLFLIGIEYGFQSAGESIGKAIGVGLFVGVAFLRMFLSIPIKYILLVGYILAFVLVLFSPIELSAAAFDAGGATTGALTVPFMLSLAIGVSSMISKNRKTSNKLDNYCRNTDPEIIKKRYKTRNGILSYLHYQI